ncbi:MAG: thiamine phosphate synthase [Solirubrobacteraceae bacterium]
MNDRRERLARSHLYLVCDAVPDAFLEACLLGGVDIVQLRAKVLGEQALIEAGRRFASICQRRGALFILNDRPELVEAVGADGVHVGQDDAPVPSARELVGPERLVGLSTHSPGQIEAAVALAVDYIGVGPVHATPTKPGRPAVGLSLVAFAAAHAPVPFFAIGGIDRSNVGDLAAAGATRVAVVRALTQAPDPQLTARELRSALAPSEVEVGTT